jgi:hypothetical protein
LRVSLANKILVSSRDKKETCESSQELSYSNGVQRISGTQWLISLSCQPVTKQREIISMQRREDGIRKEARDHGAIAH